MALSETIANRVFIVGCSRSGTTVLQVSVASHSRITSFPETFFFLELPGCLGRLPLWLGAASENARPALKKALSEIGRSDLESRIPSSWRLRPYVHTYLDVLDHQALAAETDIWVEKTPMHVYRLRLIQQYVPKVHLVHMIRDGRDVVASICHRARKYEDRFSDQRDPSFGIQRWNRSLKESAPYLGEPGHTFVLYEQFVRDPERSLRTLCRDLGISYEARMAQGTEEAASTVVPDEKGWIQGAKDPPEASESKFQKLFSPAERKEIEKQLNLKLYEEIADAIRDE